MIPEEWKTFAIYHLRFAICLLAICNTGCEDSVRSPAARGEPAPWTSDDPNDLAQTTLWETYVDAGRDAYNNARYKEAEQLFRAAVREAEKFGPKSYRLGQSLYWLGAVLLQDDRPIEAKPLLEMALSIIERLDPRFRGDKLASAEAEAETTMPSRQIVMADILARLAEIEAKAKNYILAKALAGKAAKIARKAANKQLLTVTLKDLAVIQAKSGDNDSAIETFSELIALDPNNATYHYNRALLYRRSGDYESAATDLTKVSELEPDDPQALNELAWLLGTCEIDRIRNGQRAIELAQKAVTVTGRKYPQYLDTLAAAYAETGEFDMAVSTQKEAIALLTNPAEIQVYATRLRLYAERKAYRTAIGR